MDGAILVVSALDGPMPFDDPGRSLRLVARGTPAQASCADADGDGNAGLDRVAADFEDSHSGELVPVVLETAPKQEVDRSGRYPLTLVIGEERWTMEVRVTLEPVRRKHRRKRRRRR